jgi:PAS domain S-box-containing protein
MAAAISRAARPLFLPNARFFKFVPLPDEGATPWVRRGQKHRARSGKLTDNSVARRCLIYVIKYTACVERAPPVFCGTLHRVRLYFSLMPKERFPPIIAGRKPDAGFTKDNVLFHHMINGAIRLTVTVNKRNRVVDFVVLDANDAWEKFTGRKRAEVIGGRMGTLFPGMESGLLGMAQQVMKDKKGRFFEYYSRLFDRWFQTSVFLTGPQECIMIFSDISEIKRGQKELEESEEKFRSIIAQSGDGIVLIDDSGVILEYNATMEKICGIRRVEAIGKKMWDIQYRLITSDKRSKIAFEDYVKDFVTALKAGSAPWLDRVFEVNAIKEDGAALILQILVSRIRVSSKNIFVSFCRDVTMLRNAERELADQNRMLLEKNIALREVMSQLDVEKKSIAEKVQTNMERLVLPLLARIKLKSPQALTKYLHLLEENLRDITSGFGNVLSRRLARLTQQEIEICDMVRQGLRSKEIGALLKITVRTVETHRTHIRKKLCIEDPAINLVTYLKNLK